MLPFSLILPTFWRDTKPKEMTHCGAALSKKERKGLNIPHVADCSPLRGGGRWGGVDGECEALRTSRAAACRFLKALVFAWELKKSENLQQIVGVYFQ